MIAKLTAFATLILATPSLALAHAGHGSNATSHAIEHAAVLAVGAIAFVIVAKLARRTVRS
jgi:hypothetical protein